MEKAQVIDKSGKVTAEIELPDEVFAYPVKTHLLYEAAINYQANQRRGTAATKTRAEVSGSNRKPWRQKGTGRARAGATRSPLWRHGGTTFGPRPKDYRHETSPKRPNATRCGRPSPRNTPRNGCSSWTTSRSRRPRPRRRPAFSRASTWTPRCVVDGPDNANLFPSLRNMPKVKAVDWKLRQHARRSEPQMARPRAGRPLNL